VTIRQELWYRAATQYGYVTSSNARAMGIAVIELAKLAGRGTLEQLSYGLYRFPEWPRSANDRLIEAVFWTRDPRAALSHETALVLHGLSDSNPDSIHVTVPKQRKLRRQDAPGSLAVHYQSLADDQLCQWQQIPTVTVETAIDQCLACGAEPSQILRVITTAQQRQRIDPAAAARQRDRVLSELRSTVAI
jgi:predicted transcriptional regulator of viral defense system